MQLGSLRYDHLPGHKMEVRRACAQAAGAVEKIFCKQESRRFLKPDTRHEGNFFRSTWGTLFSARIYFGSDSMIDFEMEKSRCRVYLFPGRRRLS